MHNPRFNALVLRRDTPQLDDLLSKSTALYTKLGGKLNQTTGRWVFPSGARVCSRTASTRRTSRASTATNSSSCCFDELTHFTERQYTQIRARIRGTDPSLPRWTRSTTNPGGPGHEWVFKRWAAWLDPKSARRAEPGEPLWFVGDEIAERGSRDALAHVHSASLSDNPHVGEDYRAQLLSLDRVRRAAPLGDWLARPRKKTSGTARLKCATASPAREEVVSRVRAWDFGATADGDPRWARASRCSSRGWWLSRTCCASRVIPRWCARASQRPLHRISSTTRAVCR